MSGTEIRRAFVKFFEGKLHQPLPSASLIPKKDPTMLLTIAGMVPFKPIFMGVEKPTHTRVVTSQKCIRTADLDNVGRTARHHTFFEMLGNFSFGDYFKEQVIPWAWEFLTVDLGLPKERLWISVFREDDEAFRIWHEVVGVPASRIVRLDEDDNFWAAGPTGPCGPCSEIYFDQGASYGNGNPDAILGEDDARFLEIWNLVFMEFDRNEAGELSPLPAKNIDTGMGLERIASVMQQVPNNFETDLLFPMIQQASQLSGKPYGADAASDVSLKVIADHLRASVFMIADGVVPSNEGRGYVLRRIIRRAYRNGRLLGIEGAFLHTMVATAVGIYDGHFPELVERQGLITETMHEEEKRFGATIDRGLALLEEAFAKVGSDKVLDGRTAFELHDTYGFPLDLTVELALERGIQTDRAGFEAAMEEQRERARSAREKAGITFTADATSEHTSEFLGYVQTEEIDRVVDVLDLGKGKKGLVLNRTPFYAESGGQVGDTGVLVKHAQIEGLTYATYAEAVPAADVIRVLDTQKRNGAFIHVVDATAEIEVGTPVLALVDVERRSHIRRHHTATHLLHAALRQVLGPHVTQAGSLVGPDALRFDFTLARGMTPEEIARVETLVNTQILANTEVETAVMDIQAAQASGAMALFDEKYGDAVRVLTIGGFSKELCGGTHAHRTGDIGLFKITGEAGIAAGVRRIEGVAGLPALQYVNGLASAMAAVGDRLKVAPEGVAERLDKLADSLKASEKQVKALQSELAVAKASALLASAQEADGVRYVAAVLADLGGDGVRAASEALLKDLKSGVVLLVGLAGGKVSAVATVSDDWIAKGLKAGDVLGGFMGRIGGKGAGRPNFAQGGGGNAELVPGAVADFAAVLAALKVQA